MSELTEHITGLTYGELMMLTKGNGTSKIYERIQAHDALQRQRIAQLEAEVAAYRNGGVTEELLRRHDGFIKVGKGCVIVREDEHAELHAENAQLEAEVKEVEQMNANAIMERAQYLLRCEQLEAEVARLKGQMFQMSLNPGTAKPYPADEDSHL